MDDLKLLNLKKNDPYQLYRARVEAEKREKKLSPDEITVEEANWKLMEIDERFTGIPLDNVWANKRYLDVRSVAGTIAKNNRVTQKQWDKLVNTSYEFLRFSYLNQD